MDSFFMILGLVMIYSWVHGAIVISQKLENTTTYERVVLIAGTVGFALFVLGSIA